MDNIIEDLLSLSKAQRKHIIGVLQESLVDKKYIDNRFLLMKKTADKLIGKDILTETRERDVVFGRRMVAYAMREEGFSLHAIGRRLKLDHSTICALVKGMQDIIEYAYIAKDDFKMWNEFKSKIDYDDSRASQGS